jgi:hypothetical protein
MIPPTTWLEAREVGEDARSAGLVQAKGYFNGKAIPRT